MRITKVNIPESDKSGDGLGPIKMDRLGQIVLLAGKNGSGKTRIMDKIYETIYKIPTKDAVESSRIAIEDFQEKIENEKIRFAADTKALNDIKESRAQHVRRSSETHKNSISVFEKALNNHKERLAWDLIVPSEYLNKYRPVKFVPKQLDLDDCNSFNKTVLLERAKGVENLGVENLSSGTLAKVQVIQDRYYNATHPNSSLQQKDKEQFINDYKRLESVIEIFLNTKLARSGDDEAMLFGFPLGKANLSDGQKVLLQFCIAIYSQGGSLKNFVLFLDEPENHLHPSIIIETIDRIIECVPEGQLWIATHSIPLLAHYDPSCIWYVDSNQISHAGRIPEKVLQSLLGNEDEIAKLQDFISLPAQLATSRYAFESLFEPKTLTTGPDDPQTLQINRKLLEISETGKIRVLDFGAGKGRIISNLSEVINDFQQDIKQQLEYIAFDTDVKDQVQCEVAISKIYGSADNRYFSNIDALLSKYDKESFHVVIMCNVLHEIDPKDWLKLFSKDGVISQLLTRNGILLLVEDNEIPVGEKAYQKGFLVLDTPHLKDLFCISEKDIAFTYNDARGDGRLKAHEIPKTCLERISPSSRLNAIKRAKNTALSKILSIRNMEKNYKNGKLHGFWLQQFATAELTLSEYENGNTSE